MIRRFTYAIPEAPPPEFMTTKEVAALARVTDDTIRNWIKAGKLGPARRVGKRVLLERVTVRKALGFPIL